MNISDIIQLIGTIVTAITAVLAIIISVCTLRQSNKMIEESSRPYISIYTTTTNIKSIHMFIILKNFGASAATITKFDTASDLKNISFYHPSNRIPFKNIVGATLCPNQSISTLIDHMSASYSEPIDFSVEYKSGIHTYSEKIKINFKHHQDMLSSRPTTKNDELTVIAQALQNISEQML